VIGFKNINLRLFCNNIKIAEFIIDEIQIKVGSELVWLWVIIELESKKIIGMSLSKGRNMFVAERFISSVIQIHGKHPISTDGGTWYPQTCRFLNLKHHLHSSYEKSIIERTMQFIKDRTECFDDYFPCKKKNCKLMHVQNWLNLFVDHYNKEVIS
jgi:putative transposase